MKSSLTEEKFLFLTMTAITLLIGIHFFQPQLSNLYHPDDYVGIHTILEFFSISISVTIFFYGLKSFETTRSSRMLFLSFTFFAIAAIDLLHTLSFKGMPHFITNSSVAKSTWFWLAARCTESILMLLLIIFPNRKLTRNYRFLAVFFGSVLVALLAYVIIHFYRSLPLLVIEGVGTTSLKNAIEYGIIFVKFLSLIIVLYQYFLEKSSSSLTTALAFVFLLLSELIFTTYQNVYDLDNFTGHLFKVFGYYFILKSYYFTESSFELDKLYMLIGEQAGFIFQLEIRRNECTCTFCEGELLAGIGQSSMAAYTNKALGLFKILGHSVEEYCLSPGTDKEHKSFKTKYMDKILIISIQKLPKSEGTRSIIGTVVEVSE